jgi:hypothetical protein
VLRGASWAARDLRVAARNALLADVVPADAYGRAYGLERTMDNLGVIVGPLLALGLVAAVGVLAAAGQRIAHRGAYFPPRTVIMSKGRSPTGAPRPPSADPDGRDRSICRYTLAKTIAE